MNRKAIYQVTATALLGIALAMPSYAAKGGKGKGGGGDDSGGFVDAVFVADSLYPDIPPVESNSMDSKGQGVFYGEMDLSPFDGQYPDGTDCTKAPGLIRGTIVLQRPSSSNPGGARMLFWYDDVLDNGKSATHLVTLNGRFDEPTNWPPSLEDPVTTVTFNEWTFHAENRKAQRSDCAGSSEYGVGPYVINVTRVTE